MLSIVSLITFVVSKIAVGIFAGGVVFSTLLPEVQFQIGTHIINAFWIGSISVIVLTGIYTCVGGMRAVAYNDAVQTVVLIIGSGMFNLWKLPPAIYDWLSQPMGGQRCLVAEDVVQAYGKFARLCGSLPLNCGIRGFPAGWDFGAALREVLAENPVLLESEQDEQGLAIAAMRCTGGPQRNTWRSIGQGASLKFAAKWLSKKREVATGTEITEKFQRVLDGCGVKLHESDTQNAINPD